MFFQIVSVSDGLETRAYACIRDVRKPDSTACFLLSVVFVSNSRTDICKGFAAYTDVLVDVVLSINTTS
jgi:hypothetical protein